jgi:hypothetical protein
VSLFWAKVVDEKGSWAARVPPNMAAPEVLRNCRREVDDEGDICGWFIVYWQIKRLDMNYPQAAVKVKPASRGTDGAGDLHSNQ